jgi:hypothetical protein
VIGKHINELKYKSLRDWFATMNKTVKLDCPTEDELDSLAEVKAARDLLEHNAGVVNDTYLRKAGKKARFAAGKRLEIDDNYYFESWRLIKKIIADISAAAVSRMAGT